MVASTVLQRSAPNTPILQFMDKKRTRVKQFYICTAARAAKFLHIYYARVKAHLAALGSGANTDASPNTTNAFSRFAKNPC